jgi:hypothetical protein
VIDPRTVPSAAASNAQLADWLELYALRSADQNSSIQDLARALTREGTVEAILDDESRHSTKYDEIALSRAEAAFAEIEDRSRSCGATYPFDVETSTIQLRKRERLTPYIFLLMLSTTVHEKSPRPNDRVKLFEELCAEAAQHYFGASGTDAVVFGWPRHVGIRQFAGAVDGLCDRLGEGRRHKKRPTLRDKKDAALDIVIWRDFSDRRPGKLIAFGQCATGRYWRDKLTHLQPKAFWDTWITEPAAYPPLQLFFTPFRVEDDSWFEDSRRAGILFDRCRIASHLPLVSEPTGRAVREWIAEALEKVAA